MIQNMVLLGTLASVAYQDYKEKKVYIYGLLVAAMSAVVFHLIYQSPTLLDMLGGAAVGIVTILIAIVTEESIGVGDGITLVVTGLFLGFWNNISLFMTALMLSGIMALFYMVVKKKGRKYQLPFLPFLAIAYMVHLLWWGQG